MADLASGAAAAHAGQGTGPLGTQDTQDNPFALAGQANSLLQRGGQVANAFDPGATTNIGGSGLNL